MQIQPPKELTVNSLRNYLDELEACWTKEDERYLGTFKTQRINCCKYSEETPNLGIGKADIYYHGGLDFIIS